MTTYESSLAVSPFSSKFDAYLAASANLEAFATQICLLSKTRKGVVVMTKEVGYTIHTMATRSGMTAHTLRYYERIGLIHPVGRGSSGHRRYSDADEAWLKVLHWMRATHMPIREMLRYAALRDVGQEHAQEQRQILEEHRVGLEREIAKLQGSLSLLTHHIDRLREVEDARTTAPSAASASRAA
jgi:DNA-binding transcriptional MerR regulator